MSRPPHAVPLARWIAPAHAFAAIVGDGDGYWLDAGPHAVDGWSLVGSGTRIDSDSELRGIPLHPGAPPAAEAPFAGGWVGWIDYESGAAAAGAPVADSDLRGARWLRADRLLAFDHAARRVWAIDTADAAGWARDAVRRIAQHPEPLPTPPAEGATARARHRPDEYAAMVEACRESIRIGDAYQLCLTNRFTVEHPARDALATYLTLRGLAPTHHGGLIRIGDTTLLSATPERFLEVRRGLVRTRPIKGTRPRHPDPATDAGLAEDLRRSPKERAENVMIVDLMRNDLSRVGVPGRIRVEGLLEVESYRAVHQLVSTVVADVRPGVTVGGLLDAAFPAGSMTGAPKLSAMTILHRLERGPRGVFSGCFGYLDRSGAVDLAMTIRSIVMQPGVASVGAGGGITWGSVAADEVAEVGWKARAPLAALGATLPPGW